ncbi:CWF19-like protein 2 homolog [Planococcus citri]|uniref:CWF19-like protein 2 homolog n=1 Tax=Planococcus citri TaxID=170843 RepID=UPI0031FA12D4
MPKKSKRMKKHKSHKDKKHKKHKKKYSDSESESSSASSGNDSLSDYEWIEKKPESKPSGKQRDDWMMDTSFVPTYSIHDKKSKKKDEEKEESILDNPGQSDRELNPYWKNGGTGLPEESRSHKTSSYEEYHRSKPSRSFMKPDDDDDKQSYDVYNRTQHTTQSRWRKQPAREERRSPNTSERYDSRKSEDHDRKKYDEYDRKTYEDHDRKKYDEYDRKKYKESDRKKYDESDRRKHDESDRRKHDEHDRKKYEDYPKRTDDSQKNREEGPVKPEPPKTSMLLSDEEMNALASKILKAEILGNKALVEQLKEKLENARKARQEKTEASRVVILGMNDFDSRKPIEERFVQEESAGAKSKKEQEKMRREKEKEMQQAISKHQRTEKVLENCKWCLTNNKMQKHLIVSKGSSCYLCVPYFHSLTDGHCLIIPTYHSSCITLLDEDVWDEIMDYCKKLVRMFRVENQDVVFFETAMNFKYHPHMVLHCVPVPYESGNLAPIYFKKAIQECEKEWAINKKLVEYKKMDIRKSVPKELPYFMVNFGMDNGFAHVIEEEQYFPKNFAQEIIGGMLDLDHLIWRKQHADDFETQCKKVNAFKELWKTVES